MIALQPGVVESGNGLGVSIRGGRPGEEAVYIDGAPAIRQAQLVGGAMGASPTNLVQTNAVEEASITTGAIAINQGNAQSGVIAVTTRSGGEKLSGSFSAQSDGMFANTVSTGYNRFEGSVGGPVPGLAKLRFFVSGVLQGQTSPFRSAGAGDVPSYIMNGVDTTVNVVGASGSESVALPRWVQYSGQCDASQNAGVACQGDRLPYDWTTNLNLQGKLSYFYGNGSSVALSAIAEGDQNRNYPNQLIGDPSLYSGTHTWARDVVLNWDHSIFKQADRALSLNLNLSYATNQSISGALDPATEVATRNPMGGMEFSTLNFGWLRIVRRRLLQQSRADHPQHPVERRRASAAAQPDRSERCPAVPDEPVRHAVRWLLHRGHCQRCLAECPVPRAADVRPGAGRLAGQPLPPVQFRRRAAALRRGVLDRDSEQPDFLGRVPHQADQRRGVGLGPPRSG